MVNDDGRLDELGAAVWQRWAQAAGRKDDPFRTVALSSVDAQRGGCARMVVVRAVDVENRRVEFHTDARSRKVAQLQAEPRATLLVWDAGERLQVRAEGRIALFGFGTELARQRFDALSEQARRTYGTVQAAGSPLEDPDALAVSSSSDRAADNFVVAQLRVERIDWLRLCEAGQRRAEILYEGLSATQRWIAP